MEISLAALRQGWAYVRSRGLSAAVERTFHLLRYGTEQESFGAVEASPPIEHPTPVPEPEPPPPQPPPEPVISTANSVLRARFAALQPIPVYTAPGCGRRVNLITDSVNAGSLFGGVATALIIAGLLCERLSARLRIVTRTERALAVNVSNVLAANGIPLPSSMEFAHADVHSSGRILDVSCDDVFLTTSWWTTEATLGAVAPGKVAYVLQEDERMFYPLGDDHLRCSEVLARSDVRRVVNTPTLLEHLAATGIESIRDSSVAFEPAFPIDVYRRESKPAQAKRRAFFYARPHNLRNLYYRGIEVLDHAVRERILDPEHWEIFFAGRNLDPIDLGPGYVPHVRADLSWAAYGELVRSMDLGLCLMYTPHPSYPPLDLAASGAVVVTNKFGPKQDLSRYCENIICASTQTDALLAAIEQAVKSLEDPELVARRAANSGLQRCWRTALEPAVSWLARGFADVRGI
jgi:hypothetical protein